MAHAIAVPSPSKRRRKEEVYRLAYVNCPKYQPNGYLEEKSIAELITDQKMRTALSNPFEVVRKPPKKRKKVDENCFVNEALNLSAREGTQFNPFEVKRLPKSITDDFEKENHSFVNLALNLKATEHQPMNPFEIVRPRPLPVVDQPPPPPPQPMAGIENPALDVKIPIAIAVPFTPTINHRIDFSQLKTPEPPVRKDGEQEQLTPSEMLSKKLVFSPKQQNCGTPKTLFGKSLSTISEEAAVDIDQELDCYQLELENSINEAKLNNRKYFTDQNIRKNVLKKTVVTKEEHSVADQKEASQPHVLQIVEPTPREEIGANFEDEDDGVDSFDLDNGNYQPFKRAYVRPAESQPFSSNNKEGGMLPPPPPPSQLGADIKSKSADHHEGLKGMIRRSIRMITKPKNKKTTSKEDVNAQETKSSDVHVIMSSIRRSLRKRKCRPEDYPAADLHDVSVIIDETRSVFKEKKVTVKERAPVLSGATTAAPSLAAGSSATLRNSIRRGKNNLMKNILHKKEDYDL